MATPRFFHPESTTNITYYLDEKSSIKVPIKLGREWMVQHLFTAEQNAKDFIDWAKQQAGEWISIDGALRPEAFKLISLIGIKPEREIYVVRLSQLQCAIFHYLGKAKISSDFDYFIGQEKIPAEVSFGATGILQHRLSNMDQAKKLLPFIKDKVEQHEPKISEASVKLEQTSGKFLFRLTIDQLKLFLDEKKNSEDSYPVKPFKL